MLCKNCNNPLIGNESFCPHCGQAIALAEKERTSTQNKDSQMEINHSGVFEISDAPVQEHCSIFDSEGTDLPLDETKRVQNKKRSKAAMTLVGLFVFILLAIAFFTAVQYFDLLSPVLSYLSVQQTTQELISTSNRELKGDEGLLPPEINYKPEIYTVSSKDPLSLRKGPADSYALISLVQSGMRLQVTGAAIDNLSWLYVYIPSLDLYGWLNAAYLTKESALAEKTTQKESEAKSESDEKPKDTPDDKKKEAALSGTNIAKVTAEKGLYLRSGPGVDFSPITVIPMGESVTVIEPCQSFPGWLYVEFKGEKGYVSGSYITKT